MIAKIVTHSHDRDSALALLRQALAETQVSVQSVGGVGGRGELRVCVFFFGWGCVCGPAGGEGRQVLADANFALGGFRVRV